MRRTGLAAFAVAMVVCASAPAAAQTRLSFSVGVDYSAGDYGRPIETEVVSIPLSARVSRGSWAARVSVPYLSVTGPADVTDIDEGGAEDEGAAGGGDAGGAVVRMGAERGFGDTTVSLTRSFPRIADSDVYVDATARARLPTGDEQSGLGVGVTDYSLGAEVGVSTRKGGLYVGLTRRFLGNRAGASRVDGWQAGAGGWSNVGERTTLGANLYWREASIDGLPNPTEVGVYVSYRLNDALRLSVNVGRGFNNASPDLSTGFRLVWRSRTPNEAPRAP